MLENTEGAIKNGQSREIGNIGVRNTKKNKSTMQYVLDTTNGTMRKQTQITWIRHVPLLQTTGGKDELSIVFMRKSQRTSQHWTQNAKTFNRLHKKTKKISLMFDFISYNV